MTFGPPRRGFEDTQSRDRFWSSRDGRSWRVWLEQAPRHRRRLGDHRAVLTFVRMDGSGSEPQVPRLVEPSVQLELLSDEELEGLLEGGVGGSGPLNRPKTAEPRPLV